MRVKPIIVIVIVLIANISTLMAATEFKDGATHNIDYEINDDVWVDYQTPAVQTTFNLLNGGQIPSLYNLKGYNESRLNISGGTVGQLLYVYNNSQVTMSGGSVGGWRVYDNSQVTISGGVTGSYLEAYGSSQVNITGGSVNGWLYAYSGSQITMSGGSTGELNAYGGKVKITDGSVESLNTYGGGRVTMSGGIIDGKISLWTNDAELVIDGSDFAVNGTPIGFGELTSILGGDSTNEPLRLLTGTLANGDPINNQFQIGHSASILLIPEPTTFLLFGIGGLLLQQKYRKAEN